MNNNIYCAKNHFIKRNKIKLFFNLKCNATFFRFFGLLKYSVKIIKV